MYHWYSVPPTQTMRETAQQTLKKEKGDMYAFSAPSQSFCMCGKCHKVFFSSGMLRINARHCKQSWSVGEIVRCPRCRSECYIPFVNDPPEIPAWEECDNMTEAYCG